MSDRIPTDVLRSELRAIQETGVPDMALYRRCLLELIHTRDERDDALVALGKMILKNAKKEAADILARGQSL